MPDLAGFTGVGFTGAGSTGAGSTAIDFTIGDFSSVDRLQILGGAIIRTTTITTIANRTPPRPGITAPIRQAITPMWGSAIPAGKRFQVVDAWSQTALAEGGPLCATRFRRRRSGRAVNVALSRPAERRQAIRGQSVRCGSAETCPSWPSSPPAPPPTAALRRSARVVLGTPGCHSPLRRGIWRL